MFPTFTISIKDIGMLVFAKYSLNTKYSFGDILWTNWTFDLMMALDEKSVHGRFRWLNYDGVT